MRWFVPLLLLTALIVWCASTIDVGGTPPTSRLAKQVYYDFGFASAPQRTDSAEPICLAIHPLVIAAMELLLALGGLVAFARFRD